MSEQTPAAPDEAVTGALLRLTAATEQLRRLDSREATHYEEITRRLAEIADTVAAARVSGEGVAETLASHASVLAGLACIDDRIAELTRRYANGASGEGRHDDAGAGRRVPPWWRMTSDPAVGAQVRALLAGEKDPGGPGSGLAQGLARDIRRLRDWAGRVYLPGYGHLAATLGPCWDQHPLCLYTLDWLSELWQALYLNGTRSASDLAAQAEFQTRLLPAAAEQMRAETNACAQHPALRAPARRRVPAPPG